MKSKQQIADYVIETYNYNDYRRVVVVGEKVLTHNATDDELRALLSEDSVSDFDLIITHPVGVKNRLTASIHSAMIESFVIERGKVIE